MSRGEAAADQARVNSLRAVEVCVERAETSTRNRGWFECQSSTLIPPLRLFHTRSFTFGIFF